MGSSFPISGRSKAIESGIMKRQILDSVLVLTIFVVVAMFLTVQLTLLMPIRVIAKCFRAIRWRVCEAFSYQPGIFSVAGDE